MSTTVLALQVAALVAAILAAAIFVIYLLWAPSDLIIDDAIVMTTAQLQELTSTGFRLPPVAMYTTPNDIDVEVAPCDPLPAQPECPGPAKQDGQYRELRSYHSDDKGSTYRISVRYNVLP